MSYKLLLLFLSFYYLVFVNNCAGQTYHPFPEDSAQWSNWIQGTDSTTGQAYINSFQIKMRGDTILNGISYNKLYRSMDINYISPSDSLWCFQRQDTSQRKVYVKYPYFRYNDSTEILLYDFSLQVNDTFNMKFITDGTYHQAIITYITDSVQTNVDFRRFFEFYILDNSWGPACDHGAYFEGIGSNFCILYNEISQNYCWTHSCNLECYSEKGTYILGGTFCDFTTSTHNLKSNINIEIKNYFSEYLILGTNINNKINKIILSNIYGQVVLSKEFISDNYLDISNLSFGVYLIKIEVDGLVYKSKIAILR